MDVQNAYVSNFTDLEKSIMDLKVLLREITLDGERSLPDLSNILTPGESLELYLTLATNLVALVQTNLRCQGTDDSKHAIQREASRLASYIMKLSSPELHLNILDEPISSDDDHS